MTVLQRQNAIADPHQRRRLQNQRESLLLVAMTKDARTRTRESVAATRARQAAAGLISVNVPMPAEIVAEIDRLKKERGASSRAPIMEEAIRFYIENARA